MKLGRLWSAPSAGLVAAMTQRRVGRAIACCWPGGMVLTHRLFLLHMDRGAHWRALSAAVNTLSAGFMAVGAGVALIAGIAAAVPMLWAGCRLVPRPRRP